jgi:hypothetical protein
MKFAASKTTEIRPTSFMSLPALLGWTDATAATAMPWTPTV